MKTNKVIQIIPNFGLAGAEIMVENLSYELKDLGLDVVIISLYNYNSVITDRLLSKGFKIYFLNKKRGIDINLIKRLVNILKHEKPDVIHTHLYSMKYAIPAAILAKIKNRIHTVHNVAEKENSFLNRKINSIFFRFFNVIPVALSPMIQDTIVKEYKLKKKNIPVILNGINLRLYKKKEIGINLEEFKFIHIGRFEESKNHNLLINSLKKTCELYPNTKLSLIGEGSLELEIKQQVIDLGLENNVLFLGIKSSVSKYLYNADTFILPSQYEGIPLTLLEAMATGLPIIATRVGGIPDLIKNEKNGLLVKDDSEDISKAMVKFIERENFRKLLGEEAFNDSKKYSSSIMAEKYKSIYDK
ncbi:glycosyltransferase [Marinilactibacillus kalidii]|uniref:glycosyltransferase n=1 Tax=Marinilactibacillus kalidii TaxID=2820274 RepID=UPI001ABE8F66|nr:glycosyltransferase [Marinilactibacillus kalidii]